MSDYDEHLYDKIAFDLGWDCSTYGLKNLDEMPKSFVDGYHAASAKNLHKPVDKFILKWLYMRISALKRNRLVADHVTPKLIEFIDSEHCPVLGSKLTSGTGQDTDWSIDRLNNNGAYAVGNICIMSTKANLAKGTKNSYDMLMIIYMMREERILEFEGLTTTEWLRLAWLAQKGEGNDDILMNMPPPPLLRLSNKDKFLFYLAVYASYDDSRIRRRLKQTLGTNYYKLKNLIDYMGACTERTFFQFFCQYSKIENIDELKNIIAIPKLVDQCMNIFQNEYNGYKSINTLRKNWLEGTFDSIKETWNVESRGYIDNFIRVDNVKKALDVIYYETQQLGAKNDQRHR